MQTYIVYIGLFLVALLFAKLAQITRKQGYIFVIIAIFSLVAGLRDKSVGLDTQGYYITIENIIQGHLELAYGMEWTFRYICYGLSFIIKDPQIFLLIFATITNLLVILRLWELKDSISFTWAVFIYYTMFFMLSLNLMRQFVAIAIVFFATRYLLKGKNILFLIFVILASCFHTSAILGIIYIYFNLFNWRHLSKRHKAFLIVASFLLPFAGAYAYINLIKYSSYLDKSTTDIGLMIVLKLFVLIVTLLFYNRTETDDIENTTKILRFSQCSYAIGLLLTSMGYLWRFVDRIGLFFYIFEAVYIGYLFKQKNTRVNFIIKMFISMIFLYQFYLNVTGSSQGQSPYLFFWQ